MTEQYAIGADIGGSHIGCALVDMKRGEIIDNSRVDTKVDSTGAADTILDGWVSAFQTTLKKTGIKTVSGIGIAMPGPFDYENGIAISERDIKFKSLYKINIGEAIRKRMEFDQSFSIRFINDATAFAVGEAWLGKTANAKRSIAITLGTGFGAAFISEAIPVVDDKNVPENGCLWYLPYKEGIADEYFSTGWFIKRWEQLTGKQIRGAKTVAELAETNKNAAALFNEFGENLGEFLSQWIKKFNADSVVLGGNISGAYSLFKKTFEETLRNKNCICSVNMSGLKDDAAIIGGAKLIDNTYYEQVKPLLSKM